MEKLPIISVDEMIALEMRAVRAGYSEAQMMERAGLELARKIEKRYGIQGKKRILGIAGSGSNGGDTLTALHFLSQLGWDCCAYVLAVEKTDAQLVSRARISGVNLIDASKDNRYLNLALECKRADVILDGILGTGIHLPLSSGIAEILKIIAVNRQQAIVAAVDCPSGIDCRTGQMAAEVLCAGITFCMGAVKKGLLTLPAFSKAGQLEGIDFGLEEALPESINYLDFVADADLVSRHLPVRPSDAHKGTFGSLLIIGGCTEYRGAPLLAAHAAYRVGTGLVRLAVPASIISSEAANLQEAVWSGLPETEGYLDQKSAQELMMHQKASDAIWLLGPGLGLTGATRAFFQTVLNGLDWNGLTNIKSDRRLLIDADGLRILSEIPEWWNKIHSRVVITPHPGEMAALTNLTVSEVQKKRMEITKIFAKKWGCVVILKGALTIVSNANGQVCVIPGANAVLSKAGSGDVLAGMIAALMAQGVQDFPAAYCAAWIQFQCGLTALTKIGVQESVLATNLINAIPTVLASIKI